MGRRQHSGGEGIHTFSDHVSSKTHECGYFDALRELQCQRHWIDRDISTPLEKFNVEGIEWAKGIVANLNQECLQRISALRFPEYVPHKFHQRLGAYSKEEKFFREADDGVLYGPLECGPDVLWSCRQWASDVSSSYA
ncbi:hypothetical protein V6N11_054704 [Hibiscus sabdariffa]|uniref:Uncharacterized protein n=1 Tax=Hibiscus sabdariffa TaxID=183260 RepID=A0ABR2S5I8_9ROSI